MKKIILLLLLVQACSTIEQKINTLPSPVLATPTPTVPLVTPTPLPSSSPAPTATPVAQSVSTATKIITLSCDKTCTAAQVAEIPAIEKAMNDTLSDSKFEAYFLDPKRRIDLTPSINGHVMTRAQIVANLRKPTNLTLSYFYTKHTKEEGYEDANDYSIIHFNSWFTDTWSICSKGSLGGHEYSHTRGFFHNGNKADPNWYTIPYHVNHAFEGNESGSVISSQKICH